MDSLIADLLEVLEGYIKNEQSADGLPPNLQYTELCAPLRQGESLGTGTSDITDASPIS